MVVHQHITINLSQSSAFYSVKWDKKHAIKAPSILFHSNIEEMPFKQSHNAWLNSLDCLSFSLSLSLSLSSLSFSVFHLLLNDES